MVDVAGNVAAKALQALTSQGTASAIKVVPKQELQIAPSPQAERFIANITSSTKIAPQTKQALVDVAAQIDRHISDASAKNHAFTDIGGLSVIIEDSATDTFPKYILMTGLRFYAAVAETYPPDPSDQVAAAQAVVAKIDKLAVETTGQSLTQVRSSVEQNADFQKAAIAKVGQTVDVDGFADSDTGSGAPTTVTFA